MAQQDEEVQRLAREVEEQKKQKAVVKPVQDVPPIAKLIMVGVITYVLIFSDLLKWSQLVKFAVLMVAIFIIYSWTAGFSPQGEIPEEKVAALAYQRLVFYQTHKFGDDTRLPRGRIKLNPVGIPQFEAWDGDKIKWWNHSFTIQSQIGSDVFKGVIRTHPITGLSRGIVRIDREYIGTEEPDIKFVGKEDLAKTKWARDQLSKFPPYEEFY